LCQIDPVPDKCPIRQQLESLVEKQDLIRSKAVSIEMHLNELVGKGNEPYFTAEMEKQLVEFDLRMKREREFKDEGAFFHSMLLSRNWDPLSCRRRIRPSSAGSQSSGDGSARSMLSVNSIGTPRTPEGPLESKRITSLVGRLHRWRNALT
jgi:hypothetical protein